MRIVFLDCLFGGFVWKLYGIYWDITDPFDMLRALKDRRSAISYHPGSSTLLNILHLLPCDLLFGKTTQKRPNTAERAEGAKVVQKGTINHKCF